MEEALNQDFFVWCLQRLTPHEFCVYQACAFIGSDAEISMQVISDICSMSADTVRHHMKSLQKLGFVQYDSTNGTGTVLLWVRRTTQDKPLSVYHLKGRTSVTLINPDGEFFQIKRGEIRKFCEEKRLNRRCIYDILEGNRRSHHGWTA
jgi:Winged helix-turn-helix DNA-binding